MVTFDRIIKKYGSKTVLNIPSLTVSKGEILGIVGNNGAGKTTLFKLLLDLIEPTHGSICNNGLSVTENDDWKYHTGAFIDDKFLIDYLRPEEYFRLVLELLNTEPVDLEKSLAPFLAFFDGEILGHKKLIRNFSKGNQKKIGIAAALLGAPKLILLDEPYTHLDPTSQLRLKDTILHLNQTLGTTFIISGHDLNNIVETCHRIILLEHGLIKEDLKVNSQTTEHLLSYFTISYAGQPQSNPTPP